MTSAASYGRPSRRTNADHLAAEISRFRIFQRTSGLEVDAVGPLIACPGGASAVFAIGTILDRQEAPVGPINDIIEAIFRCLHQHLVRLAAYFQIGQDDVLGCGRIPGIAGRSLIMPGILSGLAVKRDNRCEKPIVALPLRTNLMIPRRAIADADIDMVKFRIISDEIPDRSATTLAPPFAELCLCGFRHNGIRGFAEILGLAERRLAAREAALSADGLEQRFEKTKLFGDNDDHAYRQPYGYY
ncbi:hypothetical protein [Rhizorhabdus dicambivorans]|uniref:Uncharacterized protein n=1 Tax=Rhizorhabdus dicambivorans TaxID=1850238 RepID=A0A2A4FTZ9_9SPHN|nr:hypothetical protein [Rhizorhabdus dicambivorans]ATE65755.1 hypothetical protein CMV14_16245 [Rhizorhabdus dicambivorans]PCE41162.1 hypothetical protein COO09_16815 [Rhizorhabdus dicambivorans]